MIEHVGRRPLAYSHGSTGSAFSNMNSTLFADEAYHKSNNYAVQRNRRMTQPYRVALSFPLRLAHKYMLPKSQGLQAPPTATISWT